ncbi:FAD/NAD(P)-binding domain-containing protein [Xylariaceae sp. FL1651]|nr:FAD/NAD(P)-binding domain-containing protein [Xylariaceae sp. FL1651]
MPLNVIIVGGGIGGFTAALGLRRQGHQITILERSELAEEYSAAIHLAPNCVGILRRFGVYPETFGANPFTFYNGDGTLRADIKLTEALSIWQHPWLLSHRVGLHKELKRLATSPGQEGTPVLLKTSTKVISVDPLTATVSLEDGSTISGDLVLGADGVGSITRKALVGDQIKPFGSGKSAFRFMIPHSEMRRNPETKKFTERQGYMTMWFGDDRRLVMYPCNRNTIMNFVAIHPSELSNSEGEGWNTAASKEILLDIYDEFGSTVKALLSQVDGTALRVWTLLDMKRMPHWVKGKLALLGDAVHPFLPHQGQGGGMAIEDAGSLCALFPSETPKSEIHDRLTLYESIRDERAHKVQEYTRIAGADSDGQSRGGFDMMEFLQYNFGHDEYHNSMHRLRAFLFPRKNGDNRVCWRSPVVFGPSPSPYQDHLGQRIPHDDARFTTHSIRFQTSATYLKTLFPTSSYSFAAPGTIAEATFACIELDNLAWLGGRGYNLVKLIVHGVQYTKENGDKLSGSYMPLLLENLADPIITGWKDLGMPKVFCDIEVAKEERNRTITCSWRGTPFIHMLLEGLEDALDVRPDDQSSLPVPKLSAPVTEPSWQDDGLFVYKYIPAVEGQAVADAEYSAFLPKAELSPTVTEKAILATRSSVKIVAGDWKSLPTLHHIASGLAAIPIFSISEAKAEKGHGMGNFSNAIRIE